MQGTTRCTVLLSTDTLIRTNQRPSGSHCGPMTSSSIPKDFHNHETHNRHDDETLLYATTIRVATSEYHPIAVTIQQSTGKAHCRGGSVSCYGCPLENRAKQLTCLLFQFPCLLASLHLGAGGSHLSNRSAYVRGCDPSVRQVTTETKGVLHGCSGRGSSTTSPQHQSSEQQ